MVSVIGVGISVLATHGFAGELDALAGRWIALRSELAAEQSAWTDQERALHLETNLLQRERDALLAELARDAETTSAEAADQAAEAARSEELQRALNDVHPVLTRVETRLRSWTNAVPAAIGEDVQRALSALPDSETAARGMSLGQRMQRIVGILGSMESLQIQVHVTQELVQDGLGGRRLCDTLYLGLARAFAVSMDDAWAAIAVPGDQGWSWTPAPEASRDIRQAIRIARREQLAQFVPLPLHIPITEEAP